MWLGITNTAVPELWASNGLNCTDVIEHPRRAAVKFAEEMSVSPGWLLLKEHEGLSRWAGSCSPCPWAEDNFASGALPKATA